MIEIKIDGLKGIDSWLNNVRKQARFAAAVALTQTARMVARGSVMEMERVLDNPTPFTKSGLYVKRATKDNLVAEVGFKDRQARYMKFQIEGGERSPGRRGIKLPGDVKLDRYGNIPRGELRKLLDAAKSGKLGTGVKRSLGVSGRGGKMANSTTLFYGKPKNYPDMPLGIYKRSRDGFSLVIAFSQKPATYRPKFKFYEYGSRMVDAAFKANFDTALNRALATAR